MLQIVRIQVQGQIAWQVAKSAAGNWIAVCKPFGLVMEGTTLDDLYSNINHGVQLMMRDLMEAGELEAFLKSHGLKLQSQETKPQGEVEFDVPIELMFKSPGDSARSLLQ